MRTSRILAAVALAAAVALLPSLPASAESRVEIVLAADPAATVLAATDAPTQLNVSGSGFQSVPNGFGGIYVMFGWVDAGAWQPSVGGMTGTSYRYANDDADAPQGFQQFIAFPGSSTAAEASGGEISAEGNWATTLTVPGARFASFDREGNEVEVDCLAVSCGVITIGAHGVANAANETFTPVAFGSPEPVDTETPEPTMTTMSESSATPSAETANGASTGGGSALPVVLSSAAVAVAAGVTAAVVARRRRKR